MTDHETMKRRAGELRRNQTPAEGVIWARLRMRQVRGVRFLRQHVIGDYIVDFFAPSIRLAIELDGGQHFDPKGQRYDASRSAWLASRDIEVARYSNLDVSRRLDDVLHDIERKVCRRQSDLCSGLPHPPGAARRPPSVGRG